MNSQRHFGQFLTGAEPCAKFVIGSVAFFRYNWAFDLAGREKMIP